MTSAEQLKQIRENREGSPLVFISHSHYDEATVRELYELLLELGAKPYATCINRKEDFQREIGENLSQCDVFLLVASEAAFRSRWVTPEINEAIHLGKKISYYRIDQASPPDAVARFLNMLQYIAAEPDNSNILKVVEDVLRRSGLSEDLVSEKINKASQDRLDRLNKWRDRLWAYMYDHGSRKRKMRLSKWERNKLNVLATQLRIKPSIKEELLSYKRNRNELVNILTSALSKANLDLNDLQMLEKKRVECCIPIHETSQIIRKLPRIKNKAVSIRIDESALSAKHWLNDAIELIRSNSPDEEKIINKALQFSYLRRHTALELSANHWEFFYGHAGSEIQIQPNMAVPSDRDAAIKYSSPISYYYIFNRISTNASHINIPKHCFSAIDYSTSSWSRGTKRADLFDILSCNLIVPLYARIHSSSSQNFWLEKSGQIPSCQLDLCLSRASSTKTDSASKVTRDSFIEGTESNRVKNLKSQGNSLPSNLVSNQLKKTKKPKAEHKIESRGDDDQTVVAVIAGLTIVVAASYLITTTIGSIIKFILSPLGAFLGSG